MAEISFREIAAEVYGREFSEFSDPPAHRFSLRHRRKMKKIFELCQKNADGSFPPTRPLPARHALRYFVIVLLAALTLGALTLAVCAVVAGSFTEKVYEDHSEISVDKQAIVGAPTTLEEIYLPTYVPDGYVYEADESVPDIYDEENGVWYNYLHYVWFREEETGKRIIFHQYTKDVFDVHYSTDRFPLKDVTVNDHPGFYMDYSTEDDTGGIVVWDNGDYIFEVDAHFPMDELFKIAESVRKEDLPALSEAPEA